MIWLETITGIMLNSYRVNGAKMLYVFEADLYFIGTARVVYAPIFFGRVRKSDFIVKVCKL